MDAQSGEEAFEVFGAGEADYQFSGSFIAFLTLFLFAFFADCAAWKFSIQLALLGNTIKINTIIFNSLFGKF